MNEIQRLADICDIVENLHGHLAAIEDPLEYERVQKYISSKYGVDLPFKQPE